MGIDSRLIYCTMIFLSSSDFKLYVVFTMALWVSHSLTFSNNDFLSDVSGFLAVWGGLHSIYSHFLDLANFETMLLAP
jgi:hypothetical protein